MKQLLKFGASWCQPCKMLAGSIESADLGDVELIEVDIDSDMEKAVEYNVRGVPTLVLLVDGVEVKRQSGYMMAKDVEEFIND